MKLHMKLGLCALSTLALVSVVGCGKPDPKKNPDFNEAAFKDPMAIKMGADARSGPPTTP